VLYVFSLVTGASFCRLWEFNFHSRCPTPTTRTRGWTRGLGLDFLGGGGCSDFYRCVYLFISGMNVFNRYTQACNTELFGRVSQTHYPRTSRPLPINSASPATRRTLSESGTLDSTNRKLNRRVEGSILSSVTIVYSIFTLVATITDTWINIYYLLSLHRSTYVYSILLQICGIKFFTTSVKLYSTVYHITVITYSRIA